MILGKISLSLPLARQRARARVCSHRDASKARPCLGHVMPLHCNRPRLLLYQVISNKQRPAPDHTQLLLRFMIAKEGDYKIISESAIKWQLPITDAAVARISIVMRRIGWARPECLKQYRLLESDQPPEKNSIVKQYCSESYDRTQRKDGKQTGLNNSRMKAQWGPSCHAVKHATM